MRKKNALRAKVVGIHRLMNSYFWGQSQNSALSPSKCRKNEKIFRGSKNDSNFNCQDSFWTWIMLLDFVNLYQKVNITKHFLFRISLIDLVLTHRGAREKTHRCSWGHLVSSRMVFRLSFLLFSSDSNDFTKFRILVKFYIYRDL